MVAHSWVNIRVQRFSENHEHFAPPKKITRYTVTMWKEFYGASLAIMYKLNKNPLHQ